MFEQQSDKGAAYEALLRAGVDPTLAAIETRLDQPLCQSDPELIDDGAVVDRLVVLQREKAARDAEEITLLAELTRRASTWIVDQYNPWAHHGRPEPEQVAAAEVCAALCRAPATATDRVFFATRVVTRLPASLAALAAGHIDLTRLRLIAAYTDTLPVEVARAVEDRVLEPAATQTPGHLRVSLRQAVLAVDPDGGDERRDEARRERRVALFDQADGVSALWALLDAGDAQAAYTRLDQMARDAGDDARTMDQRRADAITTLLLGRPFDVPNGPAGDRPLSGKPPSWPPARPAPDHPASDKVEPDEPSGADEPRPSATTAEPTSTASGRRPTSRRTTTTCARVTWHPTTRPSTTWSTTWPHLRRCTGRHTDHPPGHWPS